MPSAASRFRVGDFVRYCDYPKKFKLVKFHSVFASGTELWDYKREGSEKIHLGGNFCKDYHVVHRHPAGKQVTM